MLSQPSAAPEPASRERLPSYLLSGSTPLNNGSPLQAGNPLLGASPSPPPPPVDAAGGPPNGGHAPFSARRPGASVTFNDRLRVERGASSASAGLLGGGAMGGYGGGSGGGGGGGGGGGALTTPSRLPPTKSLLDGGAPSVFALQTPPPSSAAGGGGFHHDTSLTPGSFARGGGMPGSGGGGGTMVMSTPFTTTYAGMTPARDPRTPGSGLVPATMAGVAGAAGAQGALARWVTVFGFPPHLEAAAVREMRRHGDVVRTVPGKGNWVHVLFRTPLQASVAMHRPWRLLPAADVMVGTVQCTEPDVARDMDERVDQGVLLASPAPPPRPSASPPGIAPSNATPMQTDSPARGDAGVAGQLQQQQQLQLQQQQQQQLPYGTPGARHTGTPAALRTPSSVLRRDTGVPSATAASIVRTPQRQTGFLDYLTGLYK